MKAYSKRNRIGNRQSNSTVLPQSTYCSFFIPSSILTGCRPAHHFGAALHRQVAPVIVFLAFFYSGRFGDFFGSATPVLFATKRTGQAVWAFKTVFASIPLFHLFYSLKQMYGKVDI
jgi:hypothetical protein